MTLSLHLASQNGDVTLVKKILDSGANVNAKDPHGNTPLHFAVQAIDTGCKTDVVKTLLKAGANANLKNRHKLTPLHLSLRTECDSIIHQLLKSYRHTFPYDELKDNEWLSVQTKKKILGRVAKKHHHSVKRKKKLLNNGTLNK